MSEQENGGAAPGMRALERGLTVLRYFTGHDTALSISEIARGTGFDRAVVRRVVGTLAALGYVGHRGGGYVLLPSVLELGYAYLSSDPLPQLVQPRLDDLSAQTNESSSFGVLHSQRVIYLARAQIKRITGTGLAVGSVMEPHLTSIGRTLLAYQNEADTEAHLTSIVLEPLTSRTTTSVDELRRVLTEVRENEYCLIDSELEEGLVALAVPIRGGAGNVLGAVNLTTHTTRLSADDLKHTMLADLRTCASVIEADIRHAGL